jgi:hypothetical protein
MSLFKNFWKLNGNTDVALTEKEIVEVQNKIHDLQKQGYPSSVIIKNLQNYNAKLTEKWKAARAYWTEVKHQDTELVGDIGEDLGISKYKVILSPHACAICKSKTSGGRKIFSYKDIQKSGEGGSPPFHPNCYCIVFPVA